MKFLVGGWGEGRIDNLVTYLTSDYCNWLTGQIINFDGGEIVRNSGEFNDLLDLNREDWFNIIKNGKTNNEKKIFLNYNKLNNNEKKSKK